MPVDASPGCKLERELAYGSHNGAGANEAWKEVVGYVKAGREVAVKARWASMVRVLRINPVGMVNEKANGR